MTSNGNSISGIRIAAQKKTAGKCASPRLGARIASTNREDSETVMTYVPSLVTFHIQESLPSAVRLVRDALAQQGLHVPAELDVATHIRRELGASLAPNVVLYVDDPALLLEASVFHQGAALLIPQPIVLASAQGRTDLLLRSARMVAEGVPAGVRDPLLALHARILRAIESVAEREPAPLTVSA